LKDLKASNPIELAEYAVGNHLVEEPAFRWWVKDAPRTRNRIISKGKSRYWKTTHKFGIEVPKDVTQALTIDSKTGTDFWRKAIEKEMLNVTPAFCEWDGTLDEACGGKKLVGYQEINIQHQDGFHPQGPVRCWQSDNQDSGKYYLLKCCIA
jgi:hypothetical protein